MVGKENGTTDCDLTFQVQEADTCYQEITTKTLILQNILRFISRDDSVMCSYS